MKLINYALLGALAFGGCAGDNRTYCVLDIMNLFNNGKAALMIDCRNYEGYERVVFYDVGLDGDLDEVRFNNVLISKNDKDFPSYVPMYEKARERAIEGEVSIGGD